MFPSFETLRELAGKALIDATNRGLEVDQMSTALSEVPDSYDAFHAYFLELGSLEVKPDWPYVEPEDLVSIREQSGMAWQARKLEPAQEAQHIRAGFLARMAGCMLGKPFEIDATSSEIREALESTGQWPLSFYATRDSLAALKQQHFQWEECSRETIAYVVPDDDINYTVLGMLAVEQSGASITHDSLLLSWLFQLPVAATFGPERTVLLKAGLASLPDAIPTYDPAWTQFANPHQEFCGAMIRVDAYGYACLGSPVLATELAFIDATLTHKGTGVYAAMFVAACIAVAPFVDSPSEIAAVALRFIPQQSRLAEVIEAALVECKLGLGLWTTHERLASMFNDSGFCEIYAELSFLINTLTHATSVAEGICMQVMQGLDTDSFGATAGSILGVHYGDIAPEWIDIFNDEIRLALATCWEGSLSKLADRMAALPARVR